MRQSRTRVFVLTALAALLVFAVFAGTAAAKPKFTEITGTTNTSWSNVGGGGAAQVIQGTVGLWTGTFPDTEPLADDVLSLKTRVDGLGGIRLNYQIQTFDVFPFDYLNIELVTPTGTVALVTGYNPNTALFTYFLSPVNTLTVNTRQWKGQTVTLRIIAHQDGFGDQFQALITNLRTLGDDQL